MMAPTLNDFFSNRRLDAARGELGSVFHRARLLSVMGDRDVSIVFFQEGCRIYDEEGKRFVDDRWNPESSNFAGPEGVMWYLLGFADNRASFDADHWPLESASFSRGTIPPYRLWEADHRARSSRSRGQKGAPQLGNGQVNVGGLFKVTFHRDGTLSFGQGSNDVPTSRYHLAGTADDGDPPTGRGDIMIFQENNNSSCYIDIRPTGQVRSKIVVFPRPVTDLNPFEETSS
jgi:hypothetical protein